MIDSIVLHHSVSDGTLVALVALIALVSFAAGVGFARWYWLQPRRRAERTADPAD